MKSFRCLLCLILSVLILLFCSGCTANDNPSQSDTQSEPGKINWSLYGTWISKTQVSQDVISLSISGSIPVDIKLDGTMQAAELSVHFPDVFPYSGAKEQPMSCYGYPSEDDSNSVIYMFNGTSRNRKTGLAVIMSIYFCPQKEYGIIVFSGEPDSYLVVYSDLNTDTAEILAHFDSLVEIPGSSPPSSPATTQEPTVSIAPTEGEINWRLDAKMVTSDGQLISNGTMRMEGSIVKQEDAQDLLLLNISLPATVHYRFTDYSNSEEGFFLKETDLPYYVSTGYCYSITDNAPALYYFALDIEKGYLIMQWANLPGQYLIASRDTEADPAVILAYFQDFLDLFAFDQ